MMNPDQFISNTKRYNITTELVNSLKLTEDETKHTTYAQMLGGCVDTTSDGMFWAFQKIINNSDEYCMQENRGPAKFIKEKLLKTEAAEKLSQFASEIKQSKIKLNDFVDELTNNKMISVIGLYALCLVHKISITYIFNNVYIVMNKLENTDPLTNPYIIRTNDKFDVHMNTNTNDLTSLHDIYEKFFCIEDINKPIKPIASYTAVELREIYYRLNIPHNADINDKIKIKPLIKSVIYNTIKQYMIENYFMTAKLN